VVDRASLAQRIGTPVTRYGWDAVYHALLAPGSAKEVPPRQDAVWELAVEIDVHQRVEAAGLREDETLPDPAPLIAWAGSPVWLRVRLWLRALGWIGPGA